MARERIQALQVLIDLEMLKFHDVEAQIVLIANLQPGEGRKSSLVGILTEEIAVDGDSNAACVKAYRDFENLLEFEWKSSISFGFRLVEPERMTQRIIKHKTGEGISRSLESVVHRVVAENFFHREAHVHVKSLRL